MALTDRALVRALLERHGFTFSKAMGQNFLVNPTVSPRMAEAGGAGPGMGVLEIGPGIGVLTEELARRAERVVCIELDERLLPILAETMQEYDNVEVLHGDVMKVDLAQILATRFDKLPVAVCANLPYYITTPILMRLLELRLPILSITVMVQREAAIRLCARPGTRECGAISAAIWYYSEPERLFSVSSGSFMPPPTVESEVICLKVRKTPLVTPVDERVFFQVVRGAFAQRRKTVVNSLTSTMHLSKAALIAVLEALELDPAIRAERLSLENLCALSNGITAMQR
ncbi:MAG: 16S rRNA (adenine(1518)-N(6)/adenine(1519)-N(6))-dimethyltransferase RsmA [Oscillospiraceae bacterium]